MHGWDFDPGRLRALRQEAQLTQTQMAEKIGLARRGSYYRLELDKHQPGEQTAYAIVNVLTQALGRKVTLYDFGSPNDLQTRKSA